MSQPLTNLGLFGDFTKCDADIISGLNFNFQLLDNLVQLAFDGIVGALPLSPVEGDKYILSTDKSVNLFDGTKWTKYPAQEGYIGFNKDDGFLYYFDGTNWVQLSSELMAFDNTGTTLISTNVQDAIVELFNFINIANIVNVGAGAEVLRDIVTGDANLRSITGDALISVTQETDEINISFLFNSLFPIGKIDMTITTDAPNSLNWLRISGLGAQTFLKAGLYANLFNHLNGLGFFAPASHDLFTESGLNFTIEDFAALSPRGVGSSVVNGNTKVGPAAGSVQEDQMQRITGTTNSISIRTPATSAGAFSGSTYNSSWAAGGGTLNGMSELIFDSLTSPDRRVSATTAGETRGNSFGVYYWIRY